MRAMDENKRKAATDFGCGIALVLFGGYIALELVEQHLGRAAWL